VGPTGVGKSRLAVNLAVKFNGEIINADSRQVYRYMDIGTAKPSSAEIARTPHHLFSIIDPDQDFGLAQYNELTLSSITNIHSRNKIPFLVGGSGQYIWSILEGWKIPAVAPDFEYRKSLEKLAAEKGADYLYSQLISVDPVAAQKIDKRNIRRVIRALEVSNQTMIPFSQLKEKISPNYDILILGLSCERSKLYQIVDSRVDKMLEQGLYNEVLMLNQMGYDSNLASLNSIGYKQIGMMQKGELKQPDLAGKIKVDTHRFIRHQYAWFRLTDERIVWFDIESDIQSALESLISDRIGSN
jgi:tRNA dimethylallyltransferase